MARSSMWTDELGAIKYFIARGPLAVITDYSIPRNHILFSLLNSLLPGSALINPLRARVLSYLFACITGGGILWFFVARRRLVEGAVLFCVWGMNGGLIELSLQARGYGLLCMLAFFMCVFALRYLEQTGRRSYWLLSASAVAGIYTIPLFALFAAPLLLFLCVQKRDLRAFLIAVLSALITAVLYAPVARQLFIATTTYSQRYGQFYGSISAVADTFRSFVSPFPDWAILLVILAVAILPFAARFDSPAQRGAARSLVASVFIFLILCLFMTTPPVRTTCFITLPLAFSSVLCMAPLLRLPRARFVAAALCLCATACAWIGIRDFHFTPYEDWAAATDFVQTMFPPRSLIDFSHNADGLTYYIDQDHYRLYCSPQKITIPELFAKGEMPVVEADWKGYPREFAGGSFSALALHATAPGKIRDITVNFAVPRNAFVSSINTINGQQIGSNHLWKPWQADKQSLLFHLKPGARYHSLNLLVASDPATLRPLISSGATESHTPSAPRWCFLGHVVTLSLGDATATSVLFDPGPAPANILEAWIQPYADQTR